MGNINEFKDHEHTISEESREEMDMEKTEMIKKKCIEHSKTNQETEKPENIIAYKSSDEEA